MKFSSKAVRQMNLLILLLKSNTAYSFNEIRKIIDLYSKDNVETSKKMFERDKRELRKSGIRIKCVEKSYYTIDRKDFYLPPINLNTEERHQMTLLLYLLDDIKANIPFRQELYSAVSKLHIATNIKEDDQGTVPLTYTNQVKYPDNNDISDKINNIVIAIFNKRRLEIEYSKTITEDSELRKVDPLGIIFRKGMPYLIAHCHLRRGVRVFNINRIVSNKLNEIEADEIPFTIPAGFTLDEFSNRETWELGQEHSYEAEMEFPKSIAWLIKKRYSGKGKIVDNENGSILFTTNVSSTEGILNFVLEFGTDCKIIKPDYLRDSLKEEIIAILYEYERLL